ncbi:metal ABC transporter permease [Pantoea sp. 1.19]|uniref:metal ABC transporter permease n=1 Tax=Pantoea sp. 1.19 TaxID=1925589 RepID=UPI000948A237|nr:metal ABC transporter permease [Pantoea sp. 1.19]
MTLLQPFLEFAFMRRALVACLALSLSATPLGVLLLLRRMSLMGDALSHAVLPGAALGYLLCGLSLAAMGTGGLIAGITVALLSGWISRHTPLKEDASFAGLYLASLALGVTLVSLHGSSVDLLHVLFGSLLAVQAEALWAVSVISALTLILLAVLYPALMMEAMEPGWLRQQSPRMTDWAHRLFLLAVVGNLVAGFQILGTLMSVGLMMLPAACARFWGRQLPGMLLCAMLVGTLSSLVGLSASWTLGLPAGPAVVLCAAGCFLLSIFFGPQGGVVTSRLRHS